ncbi:MAG TPA: hypothetical protein VEJ18_06250, partial [Planctomycetota bacterium]|nr:hypothetical protein [Planctomycetota bacterium]
MPLKLHVYNPTPDRARVDFVVTPWRPVFEETGIHPEELVVRDSAGDILPSQVDRIDPEDPSRDLLVFDLRRPLAPGDEHYETASDFVTIERGGALAPGAGDLQVYVDEEGGVPTGFKLLNGRLEAWFKLVPEPWADGRDWFAGSAYSVQLDRREVLDAFPMSWWGHDPEKRSMLVDYITLPQQGREPEPSFRFDLFTQSYRIVPRTILRGPVRAGLTIASQPFVYDYRDPATGRPQRLTCELFRTLTLPRRVNFVKEDMFIRARPEGGGDGAGTVALSFTAHYFSYMQMGKLPRIFHLPSVPDWFAISSLFDPFQGYGFATNAHASPIKNPHPELSDAP